MIRVKNGRVPAVCMVPFSLMEAGVPASFVWAQENSRMNSLLQVLAQAPTAAEQLTMADRPAKRCLEWFAKH